MSPTYLVHQKDGKNDKQRGISTHRGLSASEGVVTARRIARNTAGVKAVISVVDARDYSLL